MTFLFRQTLDKISNAGCQVIGAICLSRFCAHYQIAHADIDALVEHLWAFASIASPDEFVEWDRDWGELAIEGCGEAVPDGVLAVVPGGLRASFEALIDSVTEIGMCDANAANTKWPRDYLMRAIAELQKHEIAVPELEPFLASPQTPGWGMPVAEETLARWRAVADG
jgi:hypothetical protein